MYHVFQFYMPCPKCDNHDFLIVVEAEDAMYDAPGHFMAYPKDDNICPKCTHSISGGEAIDAAHQFLEALSEEEYDPEREKEDEV